MKLLSLDFEFNRVTHEKVNLVCCVTQDCETFEVQKFWIHNDRESQNRLRIHLEKYDTLITHAAVAEARSFIALGLDPLKFNIIDNFLEYRCLSNHSDDLNYGEQLVDGKIVKTFKPKKKWELAPGEKNDTGFKPTHSLAEVCFKLLGVVRDTEEKEAVRQLIISDPETFTDEEKERILNYCAEDVVDLYQCYNKMLDIYLARDAYTSQDALHFAMFWRGRYAAHTAYMESWGYPIDYDSTKAFSDQVGTILFQTQREINSLFPDIKPFKFDRKTSKYTWDQKATKEWIKDKSGYASKWQKTDTGQLSLSLEAFTDFYDFKHSYPEDNFGAQMVRYLKLKQSLNGFMPVANSKKKSFWDAVGPDKRVRPYMNIYGSQSSRSQSAATTFLMLKPAWMRSLLVPDKDKFICGIDYSSQEFLISAIMSGDMNMIESYASGDVYLAYAKLVGAVPQDATKQSHKHERDLAKSTVLGLSYLMSKYGLAIKLTQDTGRVWTEDEAQEQIDLFYSAYSDLKEYQNNIQRQYQDMGFLQLKDGWYLWGDNDNHRSVGNFPIQGAGAAIMRKAVDLAASRGIKIILTLHDALYMEGEVGKEEQILELYECMKEAFVWYFSDEEFSSYANLIRLDPFAWSPSYKKDSKIKIGSMEVDISDKYVDERGVKEWEKFSKYFELPIEHQL